MDRRSMLNKVFTPHRYSQGAAKFTNALLRTQDNKEVRFYDDLIKGKQCVINLRYVRCHGTIPMVRRGMKRTCRDLRDRVGTDLYLYAISVKPQDDSPS